MKGALGCSALADAVLALQLMYLDALPVYKVGAERWLRLTRLRHSCRREVTGLTSGERGRGKKERFASGDFQLNFEL